MQPQYETVDERTRQLVRIVDEMQSFIGEQMGRWEAVVTCAEEATSMRERAGQLLKEVEAEKANWDKERADRIARLQAESELLAEAWRRVEAETRRVAASAAIAETACGGISSVGVIATQAGTPTIVNDSDADETRDRMAAVQEFRKLSAEMANHSKRKQ